MQSLAECQINSSESHFSTVFGGIFIPLTKIRNVYHIYNQLVIFLSLFRDYPYIIRHQLLPPNSRREAYRDLLPDKWTKE